MLVIISFRFQRNSLLSFFPVEVKIHGQLQRTRSCLKIDEYVLTQDLEPRSSSQRVVFLLRHSFGLFLFKCTPSLEFCDTGSEEVVITWWPAFNQRPALSKCFESSRWMRRERSVARCQGPSLGSDPLTPQPALTTPLYPWPLNLDPEELRPQSGVSLNVRWAWWERGLKKNGDKGGLWWQMDLVKKWKLFMWRADVWTAFSKRERQRERLLSVEINRSF